MDIHGSGTKPRSYYRSSLVFLILTLAAAVFNYAYYPLIARFLTTAEFGAVQSLVAVLLQVGALFAGLNLVTIYLVNKLSFEEARKAVGVLQKFTSSLFMLATFLVLVLQAAVLNFLHIDRRLYIIILALDLLTAIPYIIAFGYLQARRHFVSAGLLQLTVVLIKLVFGALLANRFRASGALAGIAVGQVLGMLIFWVVAARFRLKLWDHAALQGLLPPSLSELRFIKPVIKTIGSIFIVNIILIIYASFAIIAARHYFSPHVSGLFTGAATLASATIFVCLPLIGVLLPHLDIKRLAAKRAELGKTSAMVIAACLVSLLVLAAVPSQLLQIFGKDYPAVGYLMLRLGLLMSLASLITLVVQVSVFYAPLRTAVLCFVGLLALIVAVMKNHLTLASFVSTIIAVFVTILIVGVLQIIWIYNRGQAS